MSEHEPEIESVEGSVHLCGICKKWRKIVKPINTLAGTIMAGRCIICDTLPCPNPNCSKRTLSPTATNCTNCNAKIGFRP